MAYKAQTSRVFRSTLVKSAAFSLKCQVFVVQGRVAGDSTRAW